VLRPGLISSKGRDDKLRASDADRDRAVAQLAEHHAAGRLDFEEFTDRVSLALTSKTLGELNLLFHDLPRTAKLRIPRARPHSPALQFDQARWQFKLHLAAYALSCGGAVWIGAFGEVVPLAVELRRRSMLDQAASSLAGVTAAMVWSSATRSAGRCR
jgi:hypothetical protein